LTFGFYATAPTDAEPLRWYRRLSAASAAFTLVSDVALALLGGELKRREMLSGRLGDVLSQLYLGSCVLKRFHDDGEPEADRPLVDYCLTRALYGIQQSLDAVLANFPSRFVGFLLRPLVFPWGRRRRMPSDPLTQACARLLLVPSAARDRLTDGIFIGSESDPLGQLDAALEAVLVAEGTEWRMKEAGISDIDAALARNVIDSGDAQRLRRARELTRAVIMVDSFAPEELSRRAARPTRGAAQ
jgi:acyl-CoA dehydrogenase